MLRRCSFILALLLAGLNQSFSQTEDPDPQQGIGGDRLFRKWGQMDGNLINTPFINYGMVGNWPSNPDPSEWPKGSGHTYVEGATPIVIAEVVDLNGVTRHIAELGYREDIDQSPEGIPMGYEPRPGWDNLEGSSPAMSNDPTTWPPVWPDKLKFSDDPGWPGSWNGFFGKNQFQADLECFFVMDDFQDKEFPFIPIPEKPERGGLATLVKVRGLQWSQVLAEDVIFWLYRITNFSNYNYAPVFFGMLFDYGVGGIGDSGDDSAFYDTFIDIVYGYDEDNTGNTGFSPTAYTGFAFMESPGEPTDGIDNDNDGWIDEKRDNPPGVFLDTYPYGYTNVNDFVQTYGREPGPHWEGDEDGDWRPFSDDNDNDEWDEVEALNDDVGRDGLRPMDEGYTGPDEGEGDGIPTQGEPNFGMTDIDESDQIGLTSVDIFATHEIEPKDDEEIWNSMADFTFNSELQQSLTSLIYGSGPIALPAGETRDFSIAMVFGENLDDLIRNKNTVQLIYNSNYSFFSPPLKPRLKAIPGDAKVTLYWDRRAEESVDVFLNFKKDFEGYKIYRSTDPSFLEIKVVTDAYGNSVFRIPLATFDLIDGITGPDPVTVAGASFDRGTDSGLRHVYVDETVQNGQTYFYAVTAYDQGDPTLGTVGIPVSETTTIIKTDAFGNVTFTDINTAVVTPNAPVAGYQPPEIAQDIIPVGIPSGTGTISVEIVDPRLIKDNTTYHIVFPHSGIFQTDYYSVIDITALPPDTALSKSRIFGRDEHGFLVEGDIFDGLRIFIDNDDEWGLIDSITGLISGNSNFDSKVDIEFGGLPYPADYDITFFSEPIGTDSSSTPKNVNFTVVNITENRPANFRFKDYNSDGLWSSGDKITIREKFEGTEKKTWRVKLTDTTATGGQPPLSGDVFQIRTTKPFRTGDIFEFKTRGESVYEKLAVSSMGRIAVVPNPYVAVASWERKQTTSAGIGSRGERRINFIHLPQRATIRIYTLKGDLVDVIEHESTIDNGAASWDLRTREGLDIAFGIYVYHVDAGKLGEKIGKFAIIK